MNIVFIIEDGSIGVVIDGEKHFPESGLEINYEKMIFERGITRTVIDENKKLKELQILSTEAAEELKVLRTRIKIVLGILLETV